MLMAATTISIIRRTAHNNNNKIINQNNENLMRLPYQSDSVDFPIVEIRCGTDFDRNCDVRELRVYESKIDMYQVIFPSDKLLF